jgi:hypothetical protein
MNGCDRAPSREFLRPTARTLVHEALASGRQSGEHEYTVDLREDLLMNATLKTRVYKQPRTELRLCDEPKAEEQAAFWRINGYRARLVIWTRDQWERMERPPADAQFHPTGVWCALRVD